ncbi:hypothetical protein MHC_02435 [Mycoplasma haemocanis str. Illinois]|uniref:Uncharacterized protein n=1 Tax=Mycoplasma haemocanis (strain Illinois) TaxID=1111676 RepID=H6N6S9_MYCHN|nr:hypothetical protein MHC_02435 [Mycoplasma haemocanis str. Illinois]
MVFIYKLPLYGFGAAGIGLVMEKLDSSELKDDNSPTKKSITVKDKNKECRIHKLITANGVGEFKKVTKEELKREIENDNKGDYQSIEEACLKNEGKDIFVSNPQTNGWRYLTDSNQRNQFRADEKFENYLKRTGSN